MQGINERDATKAGVRAVAGIRKTCMQMVEVLKEVGPDGAVDMDNATCRMSLDVTGMRRDCPVCFLAHNLSLMLARGCNSHSEAKALATSVCRLRKSH